MTVNQGLSYNPWCIALDHELTYHGNKVHTYTEYMYTANLLSDSTYMNRHKYFSLLVGLSDIEKSKVNSSVKPLRLSSREVCKLLTF